MDFVTIQKTNECKPPRLVVYGSQGVGKSTFAAQAPGVIFMQIEDGLDGIDSYKQRVTTWGEVMQMMAALYEQPHNFTTLAIDSADWLESLIHAQVVADWNKDAGNKRIASIEEIGYGKGFGFALGYWEKFIEAMDALRSHKGMTIVLIAHEKIKRFDDPMGTGYDRYMLKMHDKASHLLQEWADGVLFLRRKSVVVKEDTGFTKVAKAKDGGGVVMHTTESPAYQAKNRTMLSLPAEFYVSRDNAWGDFIANIGKNKPVVHVNAPQVIQNQTNQGE